jgi:hypothetical protein
MQEKYEEELEMKKDLLDQIKTPDSKQKSYHFRMRSERYSEASPCRVD